VTATLLKGTWLDGPDGGAQTLDGLVDASVDRRTAKKGIGGSGRFAAAVVEVEVRQVEGEALVAAVGPVVEDPLGQRTHGRQSGGPGGEDMALLASVLGEEKVLACRLDVRPERPAEIPGQSAHWDSE
jgi:hypothetical protein